MDTTQTLEELIKEQAQAESDWEDFGRDEDWENWDELEYMRRLTNPPEN